ncbi:MAG: aldo/keto reductase [Spirochaetaceae bacterium]|nr:MAG: aldo/keto reductase [Spirochaetaceae bacterium]
MNYRTLGSTGYKVSEIALGSWQVGGGWGKPFDDTVAERITNEAIDAGITFIDTADVYDDRLSEAAVARVVRGRTEDVRIATKCGRFLSPHVNEAYTPEALRQFVEKSLSNMKVETLDLIQLHCPPVEVYYRPEIFGLFEELKREGKIQFLGVSVEKVEEALKAIEYPNVHTVQIIFNMFRQRPAELFFREAARRDIGIIVRVPLASGLLSGKYTRSTTFQPEDHRTFNRDGAAFDKGETFSGVDYSLGLEAVDALKAALPARKDLAAAALRWILMFEEVSCVIPGASRPEQVQRNVGAVKEPPFTEEEMSAVRDVYEKYIKPSVHHLW